MANYTIYPPDTEIGIKRKFFLKYYYYFANKLLKISFSKIPHFGCDILEQPKGNAHVDLVTIAFNSVTVLELQIQYVRKFIQDEQCTYVVADNSSDIEESRKIEALCKEQSVGYFRLPKSVVLDKRACYSHGAALTWIYYHYILPRNSRYFSFLDHDIYPAKNIQFKEKIAKQGFYGRFRKSGDLFFYLWPGLASWELSRIVNLSVNFMPCKLNGCYLDTGGSMWPEFFSKYNFLELTIPSCHRVRLDQIGYDFSNFVEFIDDCWFHSGKASVRAETSRYDHLIEKIVDQDFDLIHQKYFNVFDKQ